jgi:RNA polymerase sigma-70 factor (ECF subfamily)
MNTTSLTLLQRVQGGGDEQAWPRLVSIYQPVLFGWLRRNGTPVQDAEDLVQEVLAVVIKELPRFVPQQTGSFRGWLRAILGNRLRIFWRQGRCRPLASGDSRLIDMAEACLDDQHVLSQEWDREHDRMVLARLLELIDKEFEPGTILAFRRTAVEGLGAEAVATELGISVAAVYIAKSRVLRRLRAEAADLID